MHAYLPAIGFGQIKKKVSASAAVKQRAELPRSGSKNSSGRGEQSCCLYKGSCTRHRSYGLWREDMQGSFQMEYYEPYINSNICSSKAECSIEKESARESYDGVCDDCRLGLNLIFSVNNFMEYRKYQALQGFFPTVTDVCMSALCTAGKILLPIHKETRSGSACKEKGAGAPIN